MGCQELKAIVKADNTAALNYNAKLGYQIEKHTENQADVIAITLHKNDYQQHTVQLKALLSR